MDDTKVPPRKIKVVDRRQFTSDGDPRVKSPAAGTTENVDRTHHSTPEPPQEAKQQSCKSPSLPTSPAKRGDESSSRFVELVAMLASQAELLLVGAEGFPAQPEEAQRLIDYLGVLEKKTAGNLSEEESALFSNILYHVRAQYLERST